LKTENYGHLKNKLDDLSWDYRFDEDHIESDYVGEPREYLNKANFEKNQNWFIKTMKKPHRTTELDDGLKIYSFTRGSLWFGSLPSV